MSNLGLIENSDSKTNFYTGLKLWGHFQAFVISYLSPHVHVAPVAALCFDNQLFLVFTRLRLGLLMEDISDRFGISLYLLLQRSSKSGWRLCMFVCVS